MSNQKTVCPHCGNTMGFAFGTCIECGFNYLDQSFHFIEVHINDVPAEYAAYLIGEHARKTMNSRRV